MPGFVAVVGVAVTALAALTVNASGASDGPAISVVLQSALGSACSQGAVRVESAGDGSGFSVIYPGHMACGGDIRNCQVVVKASATPGFSYAVHRVDSQGYAFLDSGARGTYQLVFYSGGPWRLTASHGITGPHKDRWKASDTVETLSWAPCDKDRLFVVNTVMRVSGPMESHMYLDGPIVFHLIWRSC